MSSQEEDNDNDSNDQDEQNQQNEQNDRNDQDERNGRNDRKRDHHMIEYQSDELDVYDVDSTMAQGENCINITNFVEQMRIISMFTHFQQLF